MTDKGEKIEVENFTSPGHTYRVDKAKYQAMRSAVMNALPAGEPGMTPKDLLAEVKISADQSLFPGGDKAGWWMKCVQLDLEAKGVIKRASKPPVRLHKVEG